jgi:hypothetical protein
MSTKTIFFISVSAAYLLYPSGLFAQPLTGYTFRIVNMVPHNQSGENGNDAETNVAVYPLNPNIIAGSAFTVNPNAGVMSTAPIYISTDGGNTWSLNNIVPSSNGLTADISLGFGTSSGMLYSGILKGGNYYHCVLLRATDPTSSITMTPVVDRSGQFVDQPFVSASTVDAGTIPHDRVFAGDNNLGNYGVPGGTAEVMVSNAAEGTPPAGFSIDGIEQRSTSGQDMPAIRTAIHPSGVVYVVYYRWISGSSPASELCDVVVERDDNFATGSTPFSALTDGIDGLAGVKVDSNVLVPAFNGASLGSNRLVGANLAIAVDPNNSANVFVAWCDRVGTTDYTMHVRQSSNSGQSWGTNDLLTITNTTNPGIAVTEDGKVGVIYQQLIGSSPNQLWETHFRLCPVGGTVFSDDILSIFADADLNVGSTFSGFLGDYLRIQAVGTAFYGTFPAGNRPLSGNFPRRVKYQRNADFTTGQLLDPTGTTPVGVSVDPFFFEISPQPLFNICERFPDLCHILLLPTFVLRLPPYPCLTCPSPCLQCPPFNISMGDIYASVFKERAPETVLSVPNFHLFLDGFDANEYAVQITTGDGVAISQVMSKTANGYALSFRPSRSNYNRTEGLHGLQLGILPKTKAAAAKELNVHYRLEASDYR